MIIQLREWYTHVWVISVFLTQNLTIFAFGQTNFVWLALIFDIIDLLSNINIRTLQTQQL